MRRTVAAVLVCLILLGSFAFADGAEVFSYDFDLRLHMNAKPFPFHQREHMQGYADLLDMLEFRGNVSWCPDTECMDLRLEVIPLTNPAAAVSFRIWGLPNMYRVTSPLLADKAICFNPEAFLHYAVAVRETLQVALPNVALMDPRASISAFRDLTDSWKAYAGEMNRNGTISVSTLQQIASDWKFKLEGTSKISDWIEAVVSPAYDDGLAVQDMNRLPEQLLAAAGKKPLKVQLDGSGMRIQNAAGNTLWEQTESESLTTYALKVPEEMTRYVPAFSVRKETTEERISLIVNVVWDCAEETAQTDAETGMNARRLDLYIGAEGLPETLPATAKFTGELAQSGMILPEFDFLLNGSTETDGTARIAVSLANAQEVGEILFCEGTVIPAVHEEPMEYTWAELNSEYNILNLSYAAQGEMITAIRKPFVLGMIDFLYELPVSACQSIMDDLEESGILRNLLQ